MSDKRVETIQKVAEAVKGKTSEQEILEAAVKIIDSYSDGWHWTGFYMLKEGHLEVGPYVGPPTPHTKIELNSGICGAAASQKESIIVDDVNADPRFIACSITTRSEIVVPLMDGEECLGEIDIDSNNPSFFIEEDKKMLEEIALIVVKGLKSIKEI